MCCQGIISKRLDKLSINFHDNFLLRHLNMHLPNQIFPTIALNSLRIELKFIGDTTYQSLNGSTRIFSCGIAAQYLLCLSLSLSLSLSKNYSSYCVLISVVCVCVCVCVCVVTLSVYFTMVVLNLGVQKISAITKVHSDNVRNIFLKLAEFNKFYLKF